MVHVSVIFLSDRQGSWSWSASNGCVVRLCMDIGARSFEHCCSKHARCLARRTGAVGGCSESGCCERWLSCRLVCARWRRLGRTAGPGRQAGPRVSVAEWRGDSTTLAALKGKIVVLDFWPLGADHVWRSFPRTSTSSTSIKIRCRADRHSRCQVGLGRCRPVISDKGINYPVALDKAEDGSGATTKAYALKFWPTYFIIDRDGIVRGAAIKPDKVHDVVDQLLSQSPSAGATMLAAKTTAHPDTWFLVAASV